MALTASLRDVSFTYAFGAKPALHDVDLDIGTGKLYGIVGPNGSGKTTLCSILRGTIPHYQPGELSGTVQVQGRAVADWDPVDLSNAVGYVFQNPFTQISGIKETVFEEIAFGLENQGVPREQIIERVRAVIEQVGIRPLIRKNPNELSGGQRQLVAFASIIAMDNEVIVIDEPTSQLDPETTEKIFAIISGLKDAGRTIVLVEHAIDLLAEHADEIVVMRGGTVIGAGPTAEILTSDLLPRAELRRPDVTELALALERAGRPLPRVPVTREDARRLLTDRLTDRPAGGRHGDHFV